MKVRRISFKTNNEDDEDETGRVDVCKWEREVEIKMEKGFVIPEFSRVPASSNICI